jgi:hypothetical protein
MKANYCPETVDARIEITLHLTLKDLLEIGRVSLSPQHHELMMGMPEPLRDFCRVAYGIGKDINDKISGRVEVGPYYAKEADQ